MEALARLATRRPVAVTVLAAALVILGWTAWSDLPLDLLPDLQSPTIVVSVRAGDRPPTEMERLYGEQIEQRLFAVTGIAEVSQVARTGRIIATVGFAWDADIDFALVEVEKAIGPIRSDPDVEEVLVRRFDPRQAPVLTLGLVPRPDGPGLSELRRVARRQVATALERLDGVAEARVTGGREEEIRVEIDPYKLEAHGMTLGELEARLRAANVDINAGTLEDGNQVYLVRGLARFRRTEDVGRVVVRYGLDRQGRRVPIRGVSLEYLSLDLEDLADARVGDEIVLLGKSGDEEIRLDDIARWRGSAPHEALLSFEGRLRARYLGSPGEP